MLRVAAAVVVLRTMRKFSEHEVHESNATNGDERDSFY